MDGELDEMEMRIEELSAQYVTARSRKCRTMEEQQHLSDVADRIDGTMPGHDRGLHPQGVSGEKKPFPAYAETAETAEKRGTETIL